MILSRDYTDSREREKVPGCEPDHQTHRCSVPGCRPRWRLRGIVAAGGLGSGLRGSRLDRRATGGVRPVAEFGCRLGIHPEIAGLPTAPQPAQPHPMRVTVVTDQEGE